MKKGIVIGIILLVLGGLLAGGFYNFHNREVGLRNRFDQKMDERTAFYDKMWKTLAQKSQVAVRNDSSFKKNVDAIMAARADAQPMFMKWVQEANPNENFEAVSLIYADLSRAIEGERDGFFMQEKLIQGVVLEHTTYLEQFPGAFYNFFLGREFLVYKPITSDRTDKVMKEGKDNDIDLF